MNMIINPYAFGAFTPLNFTPRAFYESDDASTITESGGSVSQWDDKSGNGNHATQATGTRQPITGTRTINGLNALDFDGVDDQFVIGSGLYDITSGDCTIYIVANFDYLASKTPLWFGSATSNESHPMRLNTTLVEGGRNTSSGGVYTSSSILTMTTATNQTYLTKFEVDGANAVINVDGVDGSTGVATSFTANKIEIGSALDVWDKFEGRLCSIIIYDKVLTAVQDTEVRNYLNNKWGI